MSDVVVITVEEPPEVITTDDNDVILVPNEPTHEVVTVGIQGPAGVPIGGIDPEDIGLGNVDNTSDLDKPISTAAQAEFDNVMSLISARALDSDLQVLEDAYVQHVANTDNPHSVTKAQVGLGNADNTSDANKPISTATQTALDLKASTSALTAHTSNTSNPHSVTKAQVGLADVENKSSATIRSEITSGNVTGALGFTPPDAATIGQANGIASLDGTGKVPAAQLPAFVDDVIEAANFAALPGTGESGKIYVTLDDNKSLRWGGSAYVEISASPGSTDSVTEGSTNLYFTAARVRATLLDGFSTAVGTAVSAGDSVLSAFGKLQKQIVDALTTLASHIGDTANPHSVTKSQVGLGNVDNTSDADKPISTAVTTALAGKEPTLAAGTTAQYYRGDKSWQTLNKAAVGLANVDNTADTAKPVSTAQQTALDLKANLASPTFTGTVSGITKSMVGLGNVDNTSDANKPVSTAQAAADALRVLKAGDTMTGALVVSDGGTNVLDHRNTGLYKTAGADITYSISGYSTHSFLNQAGEQVRIGTTAAAATPNGMRLYAGTTGVNPAIDMSSFGGSSETNVGLRVILKGSGKSLDVTNGGLTVGATDFATVGGKAALGSAVNADHLLRLVAAPSGGATSGFGVRCGPTLPAAMTASWASFNSTLATVAATYTLAALSHFHAENLVLGAGTTVTNGYGLLISNPALNGATNKYGVYCNLSAASLAWSFFVPTGGATAAFGGRALVGTNTDDGASALQVNGTALVNTFVSKGTSVIRGNGTEGGQLVLGYKESTALTGEADGSYNFDVDASNNFRLFRRQLAGAGTKNIWSIDEATCRYSVLQGLWVQTDAAETAATVQIHDRSTSGNNLFAEFATETTYTVRGSIDYDRTGVVTRYNTTSDQRMKQDLGLATDRWDWLKSIKVHRFKWKFQGGQAEEKTGFFAQELYQVCPGAVRVGGDQTDAEGNLLNLWQVDPSKMIPDLVVALQQAQLRIEKLERKVASAEARLVAAKVSPLPTATWNAAYVPVN